MESKIIESFDRIIDALIKKDLKYLNSNLHNSFKLIHMSGKAQNKNEFLTELQNNTLNYYEGSLINPKIALSDKTCLIVGDVRLRAKVYGMSGTWTLAASKITFVKVNNEWLFKLWEN